MKLPKIVLYSAGAFVAVAAIGALASPKLAAAVRAAYVEVVVPSQPFHEMMNLDSGVATVGPDTGTLGITNITVTNESTTSAAEVYIFRPTFGSGGCPGGLISGAIGGGDFLYVQPKSTLVIPYASPLVINNSSGHTCVAAQVTRSGIGTIYVSVTGFVN